MLYGLRTNLIFKSMDRRSVG